MLAKIAVLGCTAASAQQLTGDVAAVYVLLDRVLPGSRDHFQLSIADTCGDSADGKACFKLSDTAQGKVQVLATGANELAYGIGSY